MSGVRHSSDNGVGQLDIRSKLSEKLSAVHLKEYLEIKTCMYGKKLNRLKKTGNK